MSADFEPVMPAELTPEILRQAKFFQPIFYNPPKSERGPSARNREIFHTVTVDGVSERETAAKFSLSKTRVHQIVKQVADWIARTGGGPTRTWGERQRISEYVYRQRLDKLYRQAQVAWEASGQVHTTKVYREDGKPDRRVATVKTSPGDRHYWDAAMKAAKSRHEFEDIRPMPPEPEHMTYAERVREAGVVAAETLAELLKPEEQPEVEQVSNLPEETAAESPPVDPPPAVEPIVEPKAEEPKPEEPVVGEPTAEVVAPQVDPGKLETCPTRTKKPDRRVPLPPVDPDNPRTTDILPRFHVRKPFPPPPPQTSFYMLPPSVRKKR